MAGLGLSADKGRAILALGIHGASEKEYAGVGIEPSMLNRMFAVLGGWLTGRFTSLALSRLCVRIQTVIAGGLFPCRLRFLSHP